MLLSAKNILESLTCDTIVGSKKDYKQIGENKRGCGAKWLDFEMDPVEWMWSV